MQNLQVQRVDNRQYILHCEHYLLMGQREYLIKSYVATTFEIVHMRKESLNQTKIGWDIQDLTKKKTKQTNKQKKNKNKNKQKKTEQTNKNTIPKQ